MVLFCQLKHTKILWNPSETGSETFYGVFLNNGLDPHEFSKKFVENCGSYQDMCKSKMAGMG